MRQRGAPDLDDGAEFLGEEISHDVGNFGGYPHVQTSRDANAISTSVTNRPPVRTIVVCRHEIAARRLRCALKNLTSSSGESRSGGTPP